MPLPRLAQPLPAGQAALLALDNLRRWRRSAVAGWRATAAGLQPEDGPPLQQCRQHAAAPP